MFVGGDYHHVKSGNIRRGHAFGFCLCGWHHRGLIPDFYSGAVADMRAAWGPSLMDGSRLFHSIYGSDDELIELQRGINEGERWLA